MSKPLPPFEDEAQRVNDTSGLAENRFTDQFKDEEICSSYTYPQEYTGPRSIEDQVAALLVHFPGLDPEPTFRYMSDVYPKLALPDWVEGPFLAPHEYILAAKFKLQGQGRPDQYCASGRLALEKLVVSRTFYNYREGQIVPAHLVRSARTAKAIDRLVELHDGADILVHPAQFGMRHRGRSVRRAREVFIPQEFGEGSLEVACFMLTHPERFVRWEQLHADCAGDEFSGEADGQFELAPYFCFRDVEVGFDTDWVDYAGEGFGSCSGFLPQ